MYKIRHAPVLKVKERFLLADGSTTIDVDGKVKIYIRIDNITTTIVALISKSLSASCILGQDWIRKYSVDICQSNKQIVIHTFESSSMIPLDHDIDSYTFDIHLANAVLIKPCEMIVAKLRSPISSSSHVIFHPNRRIQYQKLVAIPNALLSINDYTTYITIANPTNKICRIPIHTRIGSIEVQSPNIECYAINPNIPIDPNQLNMKACVQSEERSAPMRLNFDFLLDHIQDSNERSAVYQLFEKYKQIFDTSKPAIAKVSAPPMINTGPHLPIHSRVYRTDPVKQQHLRTTINDMLYHGQIEKSYASWSSPVLLVKKKDDTYRFVVDYRQLNNVTERDCYPLPRIEETLNRLSGNNYFTKIDLKGPPPPRVKNLFFSQSTQS